jgi:hypothetical protein
VRTRPRELSDDDVSGALAEHWRLDVTSIGYVPVGFGSHHWEILAGDRRWFLTLDDLDTKRRSAAEPRDVAHRRLLAALSTARDLADAGLTFVVAPVPAADGGIVASIGERFAAALYPYIDGARREWGDFSSTADRLAVLDLLVDVHGARTSHPIVDDLATPMIDELLAAVADLDRPWTAGPYAEPARALLAEHAAALQRLLGHHRRLAGAALAGTERFVVTHGEPHPGNTMVTADGPVLVDWDTALLAPPERDLWMVTGDDASVVDAYAAVTGRPIVDDVMTCYRLSWDLTEIALYIALLRREHTDTTDVTESWRNLQDYVSLEARWPGLL